MSTVTVAQTQRIVVNPPNASINVVSRLQRIIVNPPSIEVNSDSSPQQVIITPIVQTVSVIVENQKIEVQPASSSISVINAGPIGPAGPPGTGGGEVFRFVWTQGMASTVWDIPHMLDGYPSISTFEYAGTRIEGDEEYIDSNNIRVTFGYPVDGTAYLS